MNDLDLREVDTKLGPELKWNRKQLQRIQIKHDQRPQGGRYPIASEYLKRVKERQEGMNKLAGFIYSEDFGEVVPEDFTTIRYC